MESPLNNKYWVLRHGRSIPNELDLIVSHESNGVQSKYGLAPQGFEQAKRAGLRFLEELKRTASTDVRIYSSPFSRTMQTADCVLEALAAEYCNAEIHVVNELKERYFGTFYELKSRLDYAHDDMADPYTGPEGGESVMDVSERVNKAIRKIEAEVQGYSILIVGHGDVLQILQAMAEYENSQSQKNNSSYALCLSKHKSFELHNGELRYISLHERIGS